MRGARGRHSRFSEMHAGFPLSFLPRRSSAPESLFAGCNDLISLTNAIYLICIGVVAFIEVRSNTENRFEGISKQMEMLGATVSHMHVYM